MLTDGTKAALVLRHVHHGDRALIHKIVLHERRWNHIFGFSSTRVAIHQVILELRTHAVVVRVQSLEDSCGRDRCAGHSAELARSVHARVLLASHVALMIARTLGPTLHQIVDPVVLEGIPVGVEALRLGDQLHLLVVVGGTPVSRNHCPLKIGVLEVGARVVNRLGLLTALLTSLSRLLRCTTFSGLELGLTSAYQIVPIAITTSSTARR